MAITRNKLEAPSTSSNVECSVAFLHPGYSDGANELLTLPALDGGGIHYGTALTICGIVAGNTFHTGFFARSRNAEQEPATWDSVLTGPTFYFFASADRQVKYPITVSFDEWQFPPALPTPWQTYMIPPTPDTRMVLGLTSQLQARDGSCRLTKDVDGCEVAHLVPKSEAAWFIRNRMMEFVSVGNSQAIDHRANAILLRADLHHLMDRRIWVPMLKEGRLVLCSICKPPTQYLSSQFRSRYQNRELQDLTGVSKECIFARIAWAVMLLVRPFIQLRWTELRETTAILGGKGTIVNLSGTQLGARCKLDTQGRWQTRSPNKRMRSGVATPTSNDDANVTDEGDETDEDDEIAYCSWPPYIDAACTDSAYQGSDDYGDEGDSPIRGRKRRRTSIGLGRVAS